MEFKGMISALKRTNKESDGVIKDKLLEEILSLVEKNPLDSDRGKCQDQIRTILIQRFGGD